MKHNNLEQLNTLWKSLVDQIIILEDGTIDEDLKILLEGTKIEDFRKDNVLVISTETKIDEVVLNNEYYQKIASSLHDSWNVELKLSIIFIDDYKKISDKNKKNLNIIPISDNLNSKFNFENFIVSDKNKMLYKASLAVSTSTSAIWNPLFIYGKSGLGKTHLLHAIGNKFKEKFSNSSIKYIEAKDFGNAVVNAMDSNEITKSIQKIMDEYFGYDLLLVDDVQFIQSRKKTKEVFFNIFNFFINNGKQIVLTSDQNLSELSDFEERFITRFQGGLFLNIEVPDQKTAIEILKQKIKNLKGLDIEIFSEESFEWLSLNFGSNVRSLEGSLNRILLFSINDDKNYPNKITIDFLKEIFSDISSSQNELNEDEIINYVSKKFQIKKADLLGKSRKREYIFPRNISIYLIRNLMDLSLIKIGKLFKKDHTTIMNSIKKIEYQIKNDVDFKNEMLEFKNELLTK